ncbi:hypothetical protein VIBNISO65_380012 [Vibrio nigripulchritudo SO65]|nr:hypothetical protein VIBNIAM115_1340017 [Vibrio nigripulchritudo AM115]CCN41102.1 hypothetical protein VIBNIFTn2_1470043 [Vibrio nigripulchritudo FTn2]CCN66595.1 hypothetical protein VIBNIPon4_580012 [Vibrio nigripulchritudo POn4]CCN77762.1 hypothetical protein VIBNISO65_380012 [Vibrio nigripulchritudo SO65]
MISDYWLNNDLFVPIFTEIKMLSIKLQKIFFHFKMSCYVCYNVLNNGGATKRYGECFEGSGKD